MCVDESLASTVPLGVPVPVVHGSLLGVAAGIVATGIGLSATISGLRSVIDWWRLSTTESVSVRDSVAVDELVRVRGTVRPPRSGDAVVSPIRGEACVAYEYDISRQVQGTGDPSIDSGSEHGPFVVSDGTAEVYVDPTEESLSLEQETETVTGRAELPERVDEGRVDLEPSARTGTAGPLEGHVELREGTVGVGERVTVVGRATAAPERAAGDADAVMTPEEDHLIVTNDEPGAAALRTGARGLFLLVLGLGLGTVGLTALVANAPIQ
jgi:hypothetical protein